MSTRSHDLLFGSFVTPRADVPHHAVALAQLTDQVGLDLVTVQDHPYQARHLDTWTLLSVIAASTESVRVMPNVANLPLRPPVVLARSAATLDLLTGGRVELGLGAGAFWDAVEAVGGPRRTPGEAVEALAEAIEVIRQMWDVGRRSVLVEGEHYRVHGAHPGPAPAHPIGIWVGGYRPRMLRLTGRLADGWLPSSMYAGPETLAAANAAIDEAASAAGREPSAVRRAYNIAGRFEGDGREFLQGPAPVWVEQLAGLALDEGISAFILATDDADDLRRFAAEVAPGVRELVEAEHAADTASVSVTSTTTDEEATVAAAAAVAVSSRRAVVGDGALDVTATPPPPVRPGQRPPWDEASRPRGPSADPARRYSDHERAAGRHLVDVHDMLRRDLVELEKLMQQVLDNRTAPGAARSAINTMTMRQNDWTLGAYCESYCRVVASHHALEDASVFPHLRRAEPRLGDVLDQLQAEHHVIHEALEAVDRALVGYVTSPTGAGRLREAVAQLHDTLLSHLSYEEEELVEPLARLGFY